MSIGTKMSASSRTVCAVTGDSRDRDSVRRRDQRANGTVESPLAREHHVALVRDAVVNAVPAMFKCRQRRLSSELRASDRETQAVAGHRIDKPGGVTGEQQPLNGAGADVDRQRTEHRGRTGDARAGESVAEKRISCKLAKQQVARVAERPIPWTPRFDDADIRETSWYRSDADIAARPDVHLAERRGRGGWSGRFEIRADSPAARARRMPCEAEAECDGGTPAVSGDCHASAQIALPSAATRKYAGHALPFDQRSPHGHAGLELRAGRDRVLQQHPVEMSAEERPSDLPARVPAFDGRAIRTGQAHPFDRQAAGVDGARQAKSAERLQCARVHGVAAQLVARKRRPIDDAYARSCARENRAGHRSRRTRPDD
jgi:hypothetical protein